MKIKKIHILSVLFVMFVYSPLHSQTCGFGCLGLSGIYGGYSYQFYKPDGINRYLNLRMLEIDLPDNKVNFKRGEGFRIGANLFRAQFDNYFLTAKGYYQFIKEQHESSEENPDGNPLFQSTLEMNHWGLGIDLGFPVFKFLSWKVVEGGVTFYTTDLNNVFDTPNIPLSEEKYSNIDINVGFYIGTGLIINVIPDYVSIEGSAFYNKVKVEDLINDDGNFLFGENSKYRIIEKGNLSATVQLNIGVPL